MRKITLTALAAVLTLCLAAPVFALPEMEAVITVSGGGTYDFAVIGMDRDATDGFDNAYDSFTPGWGLNDTYIYTYFSHPEWNTVKADFRGDIRAPKKHDEWQLGVLSNLPAGTVMKIALNAQKSNVPSSYSIVAVDVATRKKIDLTKSSYTFSLPATGEQVFSIIVDHAKGAKK